MTETRRARPARKPWIGRTIRKWVYGVAIAAVPVLIHYEVMDPAAAPLILPLALALLNLTPAEVEQ